MTLLPSNQNTYVHTHQPKRGVKTYILHILFAGQGGGYLKITSWCLVKLWSFDHTHQLSQ
uniref:Uncharacterized protein n=2 Tax=Macaca TaxID=9539 RepID=A0A2K6AVG9_MACNE|nr:unnamed protein product [Macaca fascicularis]